MGVETFTAAYLECAIWAEDDESEEWQNADLSPQAIERLTGDARRFYAENGADCDIYEAKGFYPGHDFWLTRRGHGCGFWEHSFPAAQRLDAAAKIAGDCELYVGDDGMIYAI